MFILLSVLIGLCSLATMTAGFLVFWRNREKIDNQWFLIFSIAVGMWVVFNFFDSNVFEDGMTVFIAKLDFSFAPIIGLSMLQFVSYVVGREAKKVSALTTFATSTRAIIVFAALTAINIVLVFTNQVVTLIVADNALIAGSEAFFVPYMIFVTGLMLLSIYILITGYLSSARSHRRRVGLIVLGASIAALTNILTNVIFPAVVDSNATIRLLNLLGYAGIFAFVACLYIAITTRKLFDLRLVLARGIVYVFLLITVVVIYTLSVTLTAHLFIGDQGINQPTLVLSLLVTLIVAVTFQRVKRFIDRVTSRLFFRDAYDSQEVLSVLNRITTSVIDLDMLLTQSGTLLQTALRSSNFVFVLFDTRGRYRTSVSSDDSKDYHSLAEAAVRNLHTEEAIVSEILQDTDSLKKYMQSTSLDVLVPMYINEMLIGYIGLGPKQNGMAYIQQDLLLLHNVGASLAVAVQNVSRFEEIKRFNLTLQERVSNATRKLRRTNEKLRMLDQTKDDFISMASHQLRTPLTSVKGYVSMVLDGDAGKLNALQRKLLNQSFISSQRMVYLISDLLNVSRLRTGKFIIEPVPSNLAKVVHDEVEQLQETAKGRNLELAFDRPEHFPTLMLDETKMRQVIMNFIDNAIYYTPSGGRITISLADKPSSIEFTVTDNGIGVPKLEQHHLFTKFFRAHNAKRARPDGTGLGLFMAKKVVVAQGGAIIFRSQENKGSTFGFTFAKERLLQPPPTSAKSREA